MAGILGSCDGVLGGRGVGMRGGTRNGGREERRKEGNKMNKPRTEGWREKVPTSPRCTASITGIIYTWLLRILEVD